MSEVHQIIQDAYSRDERGEETRAETAIPGTEQNSRKNSKETGRLRDGGKCMLMMIDRITTTSDTPYRRNDFCSSMKEKISRRPLQVKMEKGG